MTMEYAIQVENVTKTFLLKSSGVPTLKSAFVDLIRGRRLGRREFTALGDVNFSVARGETLGIIGANGAGKSTLLSLVAGTSQPTSGRITTRGTISSLLELGAGFHPDLTGRENVYLYGAIMGIPREQMRKRFDEIVAFADIRDFIDQPVKHYSSGMYVRLGFAVAVEVNPDILLIDEVLAVGDSNFQRKCLEKMNDFRAQGKTLLIISHDLKTIQRVSNRILLLDQGKVIGLGEPEKIVDTYETLSRKRNTEALVREWGTGDARITDVTLVGAEGNETSKFAWDGPLKAKIAFRAEKPLSNPVFGFSISDENGRLIFGSNTQIENFPVAKIEGNGTIELCLEHLPMSAGTYLLSFSIHSSDHKTNYHRIDNKFPIVVESRKPFEGCAYIPSRWTAAVCQ